MAVGAGFNHRTIASNKGKDFRVKDYEGTGTTYVANYGPIALTYGGDTPPEHPAHLNPFTVGENFTEWGGVAGADAPESINPVALLAPRLKAGASYSITRTFLFK